MMTNLTPKEFSDFFNEFISNEPRDAFRSRNEVIDQLKKWVEYNEQVSKSKSIFTAFKKNKSMQTFKQLMEKYDAINGLQGHFDNQKILVNKGLLEISDRIVGGLSAVTYDFSIIFLDHGFFFVEDLKADEDEKLKINPIYELGEFTKLDSEKWDDCVVEDGFYVSLANRQSHTVALRAGSFKSLMKFSRLLSERIESKRLTEVEARRDSIVSEISRNDEGVIEIESVQPLESLLREHQAKIISIDRSYIQGFIKTINFLKAKRENILKAYEVIKSVDDLSDLNEVYDLLREERYKYDLVLLNSLAMLSSIVDDDLITFYEIYELFDKFGIYESQWQKELSLKLDDINNNIKKMERSIGSKLLAILYQTQKMEASFLGAINNLTYMTGSGFNLLNKSLDSKLESIDSRLRTGNIINAIQMYQGYKSIR
ncbi:MAG: hypothetical protein E6Q34_07040 [Burkholderiaceae bacterium]|nr:MAG: hypothetical protein E6Q34_07040 [Burkholderiaceae bacterium]